MSRITVFRKTAWLLTDILSVGMKGAGLGTAKVCHMFRFWFPVRVRQDGEAEGNWIGCGGELLAVVWGCIYYVHIVQQYVCIIIK